MADGDDVEIGSNNQAQSTTQLVLTLGSPNTTILKCGTGAGGSTNIAVHGMGNTGIKGEGGVGVEGRGANVGVKGVATSSSGIGVQGESDAQEGVMGNSSSGIGVSGNSKSDTGVARLIRNRHRRSREYRRQSFPTPRRSRHPR